MGWYQTPIAPNPEFLNLTDYTIVVTGATAGLGYEASLQLLRLGLSTLIIGVRSFARGNEARRKLLADAEVQRLNPNATIKVLRLDLEDNESVVNFAETVKEETNELDSLVLSAGINLGDYRKSRMGHEMLLQVNYISNALLSLLLLPLLQRTPVRRGHHPTLAWVGSLAQVFNTFEKNNPTANTEKPGAIFSSMNDLQNFGLIGQYSNTKMLVAFFIRELAKHIPEPTIVPRGEEKGVVVNNFCPGTVDTACDNNLPFLLRIVMNTNRRLRARTVEEGARTLVYGAVVAGREAHGRYLDSNHVSPLAPFADTPEGKIFGQRLWQETLAECQKIDKRAGEGFA